MTAAAEKRVVFGLSNVHYALWNSETNDYASTTKAINGAVDLTVNVEGDSSIFYADNVPYESFETNGGYKGTLEIACASDEMLKDLMGWTVDSNGALVEVADAVPPSFALMYEVSSNTKPQRFVFYNCTLSRPNMENKTKTNSTDPDTQKLSITMVSREFDYGTGTKIQALKSSIIKSDQNATTYNGWMNAVYKPTATA